MHKFLNLTRRAAALTLAVLLLAPLPAQAAEPVTVGYKTIRKAASSLINTAADLLAGAGSTDAPSQKPASASTRYVDLHQVTLHTGPNNESPEIYIPYRTAVEWVGPATSWPAGAWNEVRYQNKSWYIWIPVGESYFTKTPGATAYKGNTALQQEVLDLAMKINNKWPTKYAHEMSDGVKDSDGYYGFDCSGFTAYVLNTVMAKHVPTYRISANLKTQYNTTDVYSKGFAGAYAAQWVPASQMQPGDVLFFDLLTEEKGYDHCGIYLGNGEFVHATNSWGGGVCVMPLSGIYEEGLVKVKRFLPDTITPANARKVVIGGLTKLYTEKSDKAKVQKILPQNSSVNLLYTDNGNWTYVSTKDGLEGYVLAKYLQ